MTDGRYKQKVCGVYSVKRGIDGYSLFSGSSEILCDDLIVEREKS